MSNLQAVWERYVNSWRARTATERREIFAGCLAPECVYTDPLVVARGWDELERYMLEFHAQIPGGHFATEQFFAHHRRSAARWSMLDGEGVTRGDGVSYAEYDADDRLTIMTGFFEPPSSPEP